MSVSFSCKCAEREKPIQDRKWFVSQFKYNRSAFNGYHATWSDYSTVQCLSCGAAGRTKAKYADTLPLGGQEVIVPCSQKNCLAHITMTYLDLSMRKPRCTFCKTLNETVG